MAVLTLYLDNSILGGYFDSEFEEPTQRLWRMAQAGECRFVASVVTQQEVTLAPPVWYPAGMSMMPGTWLLPRRTGLAWW